jgi:hypothetical protein
MTGTHTFTGRWVGPCQSLVDFDLYGGECAKPNDVVTSFERTTTVSFMSTDG